MNQIINVKKAKNYKLERLNATLIRSSRLNYTDLQQVDVQPGKTTHKIFERLAEQGHIYIIYSSSPQVQSQSYGLLYDSTASTMGCNILPTLSSFGEDNSLLRPTNSYTFNVNRVRLRLLPTINRNISFAGYLWVCYINFQSV